MLCISYPNTNQLQAALVVGVFLLGGAEYCLVYLRLQQPGSEKKEIKRKKQASIEWMMGCLVCAMVAISNTESIAYLVLNHLGPLSKEQRGHSLAKTSSMD